MAEGDARAAALHDACMKRKDFACTWNPAHVETLFIYATAPEVRFVLEEIKKLGCNVDVEKHIKCIPCAPKEGAAGLAGGFKPDEGVLLCEDSITSQAHMDRTLVHELIHVFDECRGNVQWENPRHHACSEVRAANLSGECKYFIEFMQSLSLKWKAGAKECARRRAFKSIKNNPNYTEKELEKALDEVFDTCYRDPAPFAMPP